jgi:hypothetical protein
MTNTYILVQIDHLRVSIDCFVTPDIFSQEAMVIAVKQQFTVIGMKKLFHFVLISNIGNWKLKIENWKLENPEFRVNLHRALMLCLGDYSISFLFVTSSCSSKEGNIIKRV